MNKKKWAVDLFLLFVKITGLFPALLLFKPRVTWVGNNRKLPATCILVSNHRSLMDFALYLLVFPFRTIRFLMAEVLFNKSKLFAWFLRAMGGIRVDRDSFQFGFVADSIQVLEKGGTLGVFPEGRLPIGGRPFPFTPSTAFIATKVPQVPIVPVYTDGNYGLLKRAGVVIGEPIYLADFMQEGLTESEQLKHLTEVLEQKVRGLGEYIKKGK